MALDGSHRPAQAVVGMALPPRPLRCSRPEVGAVLHAHSPFAVSLACLRRDIPPFHYMIARFGGDTIRCADYAIFGSQELSTAAMQAMAGRKGCLLANHGLLVAGRDLTRRWPWPSNSKNSASNTGAPASSGSRLKHDNRILVPNGRFDLFDFRYFCNCTKRTRRGTLAAMDTYRHVTRAGQIIVIHDRHRAFTLASTQCTIFALTFIKFDGDVVFINRYATSNFFKSTGKFSHFCSPSYMLTIQITNFTILIVLLILY
jgi:hypothetical protein